MNAVQYIYPIHILKKHSNTYKYSPIYIPKIYKDVVQHIYPHIYIGYICWTYMLDRFSQGCICLGQHYMSWSACDPRHIMCHPIYIMSSNIYMLDDIYILNNIVYVMENMCIYIGYVDIYIGEHIYIGQPIIYVGYQCICIGYIYWTTRCVHYENVIQHIYMLPKIYTQYIYPTYI